MFPFHTVAELQLYSNLGHIIEGVIVGAVAIIVLLENLGYLRFKSAKFLWPVLVLFAGIVLWVIIIFLQPFFHGWGNIFQIWKFIFNDPQQRQHLIMGVLLALGGWAEIKYRKQPDARSYLRSVWPLVLAAIGLMFLLHPQHGTGEAVAKAHAFHQYLGFVFIIAGILKKAELRSEKRWLKFAWVLPLAVAAVMLVSYREPEGSFMITPDQDQQMLQDRMN